MPSHVRRLPWWRRWSVVAPSAVAGLTVVAVGGGVYGLSPVSATEQRAQTGAATTGGTTASHPPRSSPSPSAAPPRLTLRAGVADRAGHLSATLATATSAHLDVVALPTLPVAGAAHLLGAGTDWDSYPATRPEGAPSSARTASTVVDPLVWPAASWRLVQAASVQVPYGAQRAADRSLVELVHRDDGVAVWFLDARAPAGAGTAWPAAVASIEAKLGQEMGAQGEPVVFLGDAAAPVAGTGVDFAPTTTSAGVTSAQGAVPQPG